MGAQVLTYAACRTWGNIPDLGFFIGSYLEYSPWTCVDACGIL